MGGKFARHGPAVIRIQLRDDGEGNGEELSGDEGNAAEYCDALTGEELSGDEGNAAEY